KLTAMAQISYSRFFDANDHPDIRRRFGPAAKLFHRWMVINGKGKMGTCDAEYTVSSELTVILAEMAITDDMPETPLMEKAYRLNMSLKNVITVECLIPNFNLFSFRNAVEENSKSIGHLGSQGHSVDM